MTPTSGDYFQCVWFGDEGDTKHLGSNPVYFPVKGLYRITASIFCDEYGETAHMQAILRIKVQKNYSPFESSSSSNDIMYIKRTAKERDDRDNDQTMSVSSVIYIDPTNTTWFNNQEAYLKVYAEKTDGHDFLGFESMSIELLAPVDNSKEWRMTN